MEVEERLLKSVYAVGRGRAGRRAEEKRKSVYSSGGPSYFGQRRSDSELRVQITGKLLSMWQDADCAALHRWLLLFLSYSARYASCCHVAGCVSHVRRAPRRLPSRVQVKQSKIPALIHECLEGLGATSSCRVIS